MENTKDICSIYIISNTINDKIYVGQTWQPAKNRFKEHCKKYNKGCRKLHNAIQSHGQDCFNIETICSTTTQNDADFLENYFIILYDSINSGYNIRGGGSRGKLHEETKRRISEAVSGENHPLFGKKISEETRAKMSAAGKIASAHKVGVPLTDDIKQKISNTLTGKKLNEETKRKISKALKGRKTYKATEETKKKMSESQKKNLNSGVFKKGHKGLKGEDNPTAKLTAKDVINIKQMLKQGIRPLLIAKNYNVTKSTIKAIRSGKTWKNIVIEDYEKVLVPPEKDHQ